MGATVTGHTARCLALHYGGVPIGFRRLFESKRYIGKVARVMPGFLVQSAASYLSCVLKRLACKPQTLLTIAQYGLSQVHTIMYL